MEVKNQNGIDIELDKMPIALQGQYGTRRGQDVIRLSINDIESYETDLVNGGDLFLDFTNKQAVELAKQLMDCVIKNVDAEFMEAFPGVFPVQSTSDE